MSDKVNMSLDDVIKKEKSVKKAGPGKGPKKGGAQKIAATGKKTARVVKAVGGKGADTKNKRNASAKPGSGKGNTKGQKSYVRATGGVANREPVQKIVKPTTTTSRTQLKVSNLDSKINNNELYELFSVIGAMTRCQIDYDNLGKSKHTAIIEYEKHESAKKAIDEYNGNILDGKKLEVKFNTIHKQAPGIRRRTEFRKGSDSAPSHQTERSQDGPRGRGQNPRGSNQRNATRGEAKSREGRDRSKGPRRGGNRGGERRGGNDGRRGGARGSKK